MEILGEKVAVIEEVDPNRGGIVWTCGSERLER
jgi:hypothetical protein